MKSIRQLLICVTAGCALIGSAAPLYAHDLVLIPADHDELVIKFGHPGEYETPDLHRLIELTAYAGEGQTSLLDDARKQDDQSALVASRKPGQKPPQLIGARYDNGYWISVSKDHYYNTTKLSFPDGKDSGSYFKFGKALLPTSSGTGYATVLGHRLELVPQRDPFTLKPGDKLPVQLLYTGKPLPNVSIEIGDGKTKLKEEEIPRYQTDAKGIAQIPILRSGLQIVAVDYETPPLHPDLADHDKYGATLVFVLPAS